MARDRLLRKLIRERLIVTLVDGETFGGLLERCDAHTVILIGAAAMGEGHDPVPVAGQLVLPRARIAYMQRPAT